MRAHVIKNGAVVNTIEVASLSFMPGLIDASQGGCIGDLWNGQAFSKPAPTPAPVPQSVPRKQARKVMVLAGLLSKVQPAIDAIPDATQRALMQVEWDDSPAFERNSTALLQIAAALTPPLSSDDLDNLFRQATAL